MAPYSKPETVLKQAEGLVSVGQSHAALQSLTEMFSSKRFRSTPLASLEPIMVRFVELCVDMRKGRTAKEGLMQYKNIAQNTSVASIETIIKRFVQLADAKVQEAQEKADKVVALIDVDDLEASETPEGILLGAVSGDQNKDRTDRALVTPWLKFLWESYRTALETLKNNARLETIYQQIAHQAFKFCLKHVRKVEFRRLCETLRLHLANVAKYSHQPHSINLSDPDTLQHHLDTRFAQLNTSVELELWQEAFRSVEDIHNLLTMAKKAPRPAMMANYYEKLTRIFMTSGNALFHAAAWSRYYAIVRTSGVKSEDELQKLAGLVLISALAVPTSAEFEDAEEGKGRNGRLTAIMALSRMPTRVGLLKEALSRSTLKLSPPPVRALYDIIEVSFEPLTICAVAAPVFRELALDSAYAPYLPLLHRVLVSRLLSQLSQVYTSIKISHISNLVSPLNDAGLQCTPHTEGQIVPGIWDKEHIEAFVMSAARRGDLPVRVDHAQGTITFTADMFLTTSFPNLQPTPGALVVTRVSTLASTLHNTLQTLWPPSQLSQDDKLQALITAAQAERKAVQVRRAIVARRRELLSELSVRKEKEEASRKAEQTRREREEEGKRAVEEIRRRELEKVKREMEIIRNEEARRLAQSLKESGNLRVAVEEMDSLDPDNLMKLQVAHLEKEKRELNERLRTVAKRIDHLERAFRKEERPLLTKDYELQQADDRGSFLANVNATLVASKEKHALDMDSKVRLLRMMDDYKTKCGAIDEKHKEEFMRRKAVVQKKIDEEKARRRSTVLKAREQERKAREEEERRIREEEEEQRRREARLRAEEEAARAAEEAERIAREERFQVERKKREEERAQAAEASRLQQQREEEATRRAEERRAAAKAATRTSAPLDESWRRGPSTASPATSLRPEASSLRSPTETPSTPKFRRGAAPGSGWREREAAKKAATNGDSGSKPTLETDEEGFQTVPKRQGAWKSSRGRGQ